MSRKTKCCKEYKRAGKYCQNCPLKCGKRTRETGFQLLANLFLPLPETIAAAENRLTRGAAK